MNEALRNDVVRRWQAGASQRAIARELGISRQTVKHILADVAAARASGAAASDLPRPPVRRPSQLDAYEDCLRDLLGRYPDLTATRAYEELRARGFRGGYTIVRERLRQLRPRPTPAPVVRFETAPGQQAQMDYSTYDLDFTEEGRRRVYLFSYGLGYSRRQYLCFAESQDFLTTLRLHVRAFDYFGGVAATCLYDNMKVVVLRHDDEGPLFNPRFLAFATHYGFQPRACRPRRPQTKGKIERPFSYVETSLLNGRTFHTLAHLNEVTAWWLTNVADVRVHRETKQRPIDRFAQEQPHLLPLPAQPYDTALVVYRVVNVEGFVTYQQHAYSVPWRHLGQTLPLRITEDAVIIYSPDIIEIARHRLGPRDASGQKYLLPAHRPPDDSQRQHDVLRERYAALGTLPCRFFDGLVQQQRQGKCQAQKVLALLTTYARPDWLAALERAVRFGAYSAAAVERILAAVARPKSILEGLAEEGRLQLTVRATDPIGPRPTADYQALLPEEPPHHGPAQPPSPNQAAPDTDPSTPGPT